MKRTAVRDAVTRERELRISPMSWVYVRPALRAAIQALGRRPPGIGVGLDRGDPAIRQATLDTGIVRSAPLVARAVVWSGFTVSSGRSRRRRTWCRGAPVPLPRLPPAIPRPLGQLREVQLDERRAGCRADHADVELAALDIFLDQRGEFCSRAAIGDPLHQLADRRHRRVELDADRPSLARRLRSGNARSCEVKPRTTSNTGDVDTVELEDLPALSARKIIVRPDPWRCRQLG